MYLDTLINVGASPWLSCVRLKEGGRRDGLNVVAVLKAMGLESDQEALQLAGCDGASASLLVPTLQDCKALNVFTQRQALEYLGAPGGAGLHGAVGGWGGVCITFGAGDVCVLTGPVHALSLPSLGGSGSESCQGCAQ